MNFVVDLGEGESATDRNEFDQAIESACRCEYPLAIGLSGELFDVGFVLRREDVFRERFDMPVVFELFSAVVSLR